MVDTTPPLPFLPRTRTAKRRHSRKKQQLGELLHQASSMILNDARVPLNKQHLQAITKGTTFIPNHPPRQATVKEDLERLRRGLNLRYFWSGRPKHNYHSSLVSTIIKSSWQPPDIIDHQNPAWAGFVYDVTEASKLKEPPNLPRRSFNKWLELASGPSAFIVPADKGGRIVFWSKADYHKEAQRQLNDETVYERLTKEEATRRHEVLHQEKLRLITRLRTAKNITKSEAARLCLQDCRFPAIYFLPKIHKAKRPDTGTFPGRPIIAATSNCLRSLDAWLAKVCSPLLKVIPGSLQDTPDLIRNLESIPPHSLPLFASLFSADVEALYPSIPWEEGISAATRFYATNFHVLLRFAADNGFLPPPKPLLFRELLSLILKNNIFHFRDEAWFQQKSGTAMGCSLSVYVANTFMYYRTKHLIDNPPANLLYLWRYIDDLVGITTATAEEIPALFGPISEDGPSVTDDAIKLTFVTPQPEEELSALDLLIRLAEGKPRVRLYRKPTDGHQYLHWTSSHPLHVRASIPYSQLVRVARNCADPLDTITARDELLDRFRTRGYPEAVLNAAAERLDVTLREKGRQHFLQPSIRPPPPEAAFITTFNPAAASYIAEAASTFWTRIKSHPPVQPGRTEYGHVLPHRLQVVYRAGRSLGSHLGPILKRGVQDPLSLRT